MSGIIKLGRFLFLLQATGKVAAVLQVKLFNRYHAISKRKANAQIDLEVCRIVAKSALTSDSGSDDLRQIYSTSTLKSLVTSTDFYADSELLRKTVAFFYGEQFYADRWIRAAIDPSIDAGTNTNTSSGSVFGRREADFSQLDVDGRSTAVRWGVLVLHVWLAVVSRLDRATALICTNADVQEALDDWDAALAFYTGSLVEERLPVGGYLLYNLAETCGPEFGTCTKDQEAPVNTQLVDYFVEGRRLLENIPTKSKSIAPSTSDCDNIRHTVASMRSLLFVPLVQATFRTAYSLDRLNDIRPKTQGEAAAFSTALSSILYVYSPGGADLIYADFQSGKCRRRKL